MRANQTIDSPISINRNKSLLMAILYLIHCVLVILWLLINMDLDNAFLKIWDQLAPLVTP